MKTRWIRGIAWVIALLLTVMALGACATKNTSTTTLTTQSALSPVTLRFFFPGEKLEATDEVWAAVADKTKDQLNAKFEINFVSWDDYPDKIQLMTASGDNFDLDFDGDWFIYPTLVNKGAYLDLTDLLPKYAPKLYAKYKELGIYKSGTVNGRLYALPWTVTSVARTCFTYRADLGRKYGITKSELNTIEDVDAYLHAIKNGDPSIKPMSYDIVNWSILSPLYAKYEYDNMAFYDLTISLNDPKCTVVPVEQTEMFKEMCMWAKKWYDDGIIAKDMISSEYTAPADFDAGNQAALFSMFEASSIGLNMLGEDTPFDTGDGIKRGSILYPDKKCRVYPPLNNIVVINKNAANPERTLMFLELMGTSQDVYDLVMYGIKDKTYKLGGTAGKTVLYPDGLDHNTGTASLYLEWNGQWGFWRDNLRRPGAGYSEKMFEKLNVYNALPSQVSSPISGLMPNTESIKTEIAKRQALYDELGKLLYFGAVQDVDAALNDYIAKQKAAGLDKILAEVQKQVDAWIAVK